MPGEVPVPTEAPLPLASGALRATGLYEAAEVRKMTRFAYERGVAAGRSQAAAEITEKIQAALDEPHEALPFDHEDHRGLRRARAMVRDFAEGSDG